MSRLPPHSPFTRRPVRSVAPVPRKPAAAGVLAAKPQPKVGTRPRIRLKSDLLVLASPRDGA